MASTTPALGGMGRRALGASRSVVYMDLLTFNVLAVYRARGPWHDQGTAVYSLVVFGFG